MMKATRKFASAFCAASAVAFAFTLLVHWGASITFAQTDREDQAQSVAVLADVQPQWRYTRMGWQDANEWAMTGQIEAPPDRRFDNLHPAVLAMLILFSVLVTIFWASNEWELAQVVGERKRSHPLTTD